MTAPADRVQLLKQESTALGGDDADAVEWGSSPLDPGEDAPEVRGVFYQPATGDGPKDEAVYTTRDAFGNLVFKDANNPEKTLSDLTGGSGVSYTDFLLEDDPIAETGVADAQYAITRTGNLVSNETWKRANNTNIKTIDYTYVGNKITSEVRKVYAADGVTIVAQVTWTYTYSGSLINGGTMVRNV